jgi:hypothetical protein
MKRLTLALAAIGLSAACGAYAALPTGAGPTEVSVPQLPGGFVIGLMGDYLQPMSSNGDLDYASVNTGTSPNFASSLNDVDPGYDWGWGANIGYVFPQTGNDINLSYEYLSTSDTNHTGVVALPAGVTSIVDNPFDDILDGTGVITGIGGKAEYTLNQVDLTVGQFINVGCRLSLHPNVGLRWASVDRDFYTAAVGGFTSAVSGGSPVFITTDNFAVGSHDSSDFSGIGPLAGIDASYYIGMGFGAVAHVDSALLIGSVDDKLTVVASEFPLSSTFQQTFPAVQSFSVSSDNDNRVVPVVDMKLGLDYTYLFNNAANSDLTLEVGWRASQYFNPVDRTQGEFALNTASVAPFVGSSAAVARTTSDVAFQGPYATLVLHV